MKIGRSLKLIPVALTVVALITACDDGTGDPKSDVSKQSASVICQEFIKKDSRIKSPGSLKFSGVSSTTIKVLSTKSPWKYGVTGWIDSENDFGAVKRNRYLCEVSTRDKGDNWHLNDLTFLTHN